MNEKKIKLMIGGKNLKEKSKRQITMKKIGAFVAREAFLTHFGSSAVTKTNAGARGGTTWNAQASMPSRKILPIWTSFASTVVALKKMTKRASHPKRGSNRTDIYRLYT